MVFCEERRSRLAGLADATPSMPVALIPCPSVSRSFLPNFRCYGCHEAPDCLTSPARKRAIATHPPTGRA